MGKSGALVPESVREVERAEAAGLEDSVELPARLASFGAYERAAGRAVADDAATTENNEQRAAKSNVVPLSSARKSSGRTMGMLRVATGFVLGAAAASVLWVGLRPPEVEPPRIGGVAGELTSTPPKPKAPLRVEVDASCKDCCAGVECAATKNESCASGRRCVGCSVGDDKNVFKLRVSALGLSEEGRAWFATAGLNLATLSICADAYGQALGCRSAVEEPRDLVEWASFPVTTTSAQLVGGLRVQLLDPKSKQEHASWKSAVTVSADTLCRGVAARLTLPDGLVLGKVSAFFDDTYFVELGRAANVPGVETLRSAYAFEQASADVYETSAPGERRFALVLGPFNRDGAERLRWQLLEQESEAHITFGDDHVGRPRPR
jgi:hypothetical protein